jgi:hypothetical protein
VYGLDGETITPLESSDDIQFVMDQPTIGAGALMAGRRIVQVLPNGVKVLDGCSIVQEFVASDGLDTRGGLGCESNTIVYVLRCRARVCHHHHHHDHVMYPAEGMMPQPPHTRH